MKSRNIIRQPIDVAAAGNTTLIPAEVSRFIKVAHFTVVSGGLVDIRFQTTTGAILTGPLPLAAFERVVVSGIAVPPWHHFESGPGHGLVINLSAAVQVGGWVVAYIE